MGFSTNITIQNDFWHNIAEDPQALVEGIARGMNDGTNSPHHIAYAMKQPEDHYLRRELWELEYQTAPQGVTVHKAQHNDVPQVIASTYGSYAVAAHELPVAIDYGWLDLNPYNEKQAENIAKELTRLARDIRARAKAAKASREAS